MSSPYDNEAHYALKHTTQWVGYKVHITEACEDELPLLITHIETTSAPVTDGQATPKIHAALEQRTLLPGTHIVDTGFLDAGLLAVSQEQYEVDLLGPTRLDYRWQARAGEGLAVQHFAIDCTRQQAICPAGKTSISWTPALDNYGGDTIKIEFSSKDCRTCCHLSQCIRSKRPAPRRTLTITPKHHYHALQAARQREETTLFRQEYARRALDAGTTSAAFESPVYGVLATSVWRVSASHIT